MPEKRVTKADLLAENKTLRSKISELEQFSAKRENDPMQIRSSALKFLNFFKTNPCLVTISEFRTGRLIDINDAYVKITGYTLAEALGRTTTELGIWVDNKAREKMVALIDDGNKFCNVETRLRTKSGEILTILLSGEKFLIGDDEYFFSLAVDITKQKQTERALKEATLMLESTVKSSPLAIIVADNDGKISVWNPAAERLFGWKRVEAIGRSVPIIPEEKKQEFEEIREIITRRETIWLKRTQRKAKNGSLLDVSLSVAPVTNADGDLIGRIGIYTDITGHLRAEEKVRESEHSYRTLFDNANEAIFVASQEKIVFLNPMTIRILGYPAEELMAQPFINFIHPDDRIIVLENHKKRLSGEEFSSRYSFRIITKDGSVRWVYISTNLITWNERPATLNFITDITKRRYAEEALQVSEAKYRLLANKMTDIVWMMDLNLRTTYVSPSVEAALGFTPEERMAQDASEQLTPASISSAFDMLANELALEQEGKADPERKITFEAEYYHKNGSVLWFENIISGIRDEQGFLTGLHGVSRDITKRKKADEALLESDIRFKKLSFHVPGMIYQFMKRPDGTYCMPFTTGTIRNIFGCSPEDVREDFTPIARVILSDDFDRVKSSIESSAKHMTVWQCEYRVKIPGQSARWMFGQSTPEKLADGSIIWHGFNTDITDRKRIEEALRESEVKYRLLAENATDVIWVVGMDMRLTYVSPSITRLLGFTVEESIARTMQQAFTPSSFEKAMQVFAEEMAIESAGQDTPSRSLMVELELVCKDGSTVPVEGNFCFLRDPTGNAIGILAIIRDITERRKAEVALRESEKKYRDLVDFLPIAVSEIDINGNIISGNHAIFNLFGYTPDDLEKGLNISQLFPPKEMERIRAGIQAILQGERTKSPEYTGIRKDGTTLPLIAVSSPIIRDEKPLGIRVAIIDITERKLAEETLQKANLSLAKAQSIAHIGNWELEVKSNEIYCSDEVYRILGKYPLRDINTLETCIDSVYPDDREMFKEAIKEAIKQGIKSEIEHRVVRSDGSVREVCQRIEPVYNDSNRPVSVIGLVLDITEHQKAERDLQKARDLLLQSEKLAAVGRLSAGVAHEILNPVNIISMELQILQNMASLSSEVQEEVNICMQQIGRIVTISENLKQFSRITEKKMTMANINDIIAHLLTLHASQLKIEEIETAVSYQTDLPEIIVDRTKIEEVILNLISNAMAAMEGKENKVLRIKTEKEVIYGNDDQLKITIADTGTGIKSEHISQIFDPFFTTKGQGKGTGLGLSISYGIVSDHGGSIWVKNNEWGGASFYVRLPLKTNMNKINGGH